MRNKIKTTIALVIGFIGGIILLSSATTYNSEEISYDNTISGAEAENVKDAIDYLYDHSICGNNMSCLESPIVTITVNGPGSVNKTSLSVPINGSSILEVTPNEGYVLQKVECKGGYEVGTYKEYSNTGAESKQNIEISNTRLFDNNTCTVTFGTNEISVSSQQTGGNEYDVCNSNNSGCICYQMSNNVTNFTYGSHTGCNFKSKTCKQTINGLSFDCKYLIWDSRNFWYNGDGVNGGAASCSGVITCAT